MSTKDVASFVVATRFDKLPSDVVAHAKVAIRDNLGVSLAAHKDQAVEAARKLAMTMGGKEQSTMIGTGVKVPCNIAALVNAVMASTLDMDDGAMGPTGGRGHPGAMIVPSSLVIAEYQNATGKDLIEAVVVGYEVALVTAWIIRGTEKPIASRLRVCAGISGTYGVAAAAAKLLKLNVDEITNALGIAEAHCPFPQIDTVITGTAMTKEGCGWAAMTGVTAALLAQAGFGGPVTLYDLPGYPKEPLETLGRDWGILSLYFKPYAACRLSHAALDGLLELVKQHNLTSDDIKTIAVSTSDYARGLSNYRPVSIWQAQYSIPFVIGAAIAEGEVGPEQVASDRLGDKVILDQADKVKIMSDVEVNALLPLMFGSKVKIVTTNGREFSTFKRYPRGGPQDPLSEAELKEKFVKLATKALGPDRAQDLGRCLDTLENIDNVSKLVKKVS